MGNILDWQKYIISIYLSLKMNDIWKLEIKCENDRNLSILFESIYFLQIRFS